MPSKIEKELTPEEVVGMLDTLAKTPGGDVLRVIQAEAEKRGIKVSLMGASSFRDGALHPYITRLREAKLKSEMLADAITSGDETGLLAGARTTLAEQMIDFLMTDGATPKQFSSLAMALNMLSSSNQGDKKTAAALEVTAARLREFEAKEEERKQKAQELDRRKRALVEKGGLSEEAVALMEEALKIHAGA
jgi:hypothetical protein